MSQQKTIFFFFFHFCLWLQSVTLKISHKLTIRLRTLVPSNTKKKTKQKSKFNLDMITCFYFLFLFIHCYNWVKAIFKKIRKDGLQSASANITLGLLPPSSSVVLFILDAPAACIIIWPTCIKISIKISLDVHIQSYIVYNQVNIKNIYRLLLQCTIKQIYTKMYI